MFCCQALYRLAYELGLLAPVYRRLLFLFIAAYIVLVVLLIDLLQPGYLLFHLRPYVLRFSSHLLLLVVFIGSVASSELLKLGWRVLSVRFALSLLISYIKLSSFVITTFIF